MKAFIKYIGVLDNNGNIHGLTLDKGLNIITGRSSTGKSAIINIFDYCMGAVVNNIPHGIISNSASLYFVVYNIDNKYIVLARENKKNSQGFFKYETEIMQLDDFDNDYFKREYFISLDDYIRQIGSVFGLNISDIDEFKQDAPRNKKGHPSVRNMMSFMLQHQNLIANNQALFYRFDDTERRERVIEEFKIFLGLVDQNYFLMMQRLDEIKKRLKHIERSISSFHQQLQLHVPYIDEQRDHFFALTGKIIFPDVSSKQILKCPVQYLDGLNEYIPEIDIDTLSYQQAYENLKQHQNKLIGEKRELVLKLSDIESSIRMINDYRDKMGMVKPIKEALHQQSRCPFCGKPSDSTQNAANSLVQAINWLNKELRETPSLFKSYLPQRKDLNDKIRELDTQIKEITSRLDAIKDINLKLKKNKSLEEQTNFVLSNIRNELLWVISEKENNLEFEKNDLQKEKNKIEDHISQHYNVENRISLICENINHTMNVIASGLAFEYHPINLTFDIQKFELYSVLDGEKVYLSSMGSGANWLYSHICLFLSFLKLFICEKKCVIPPILFIDQPSQVYFPVQNDTLNEFDASALKSGIEANIIDEDLFQVSNLYTQILRFVEDLYRDFGVMPQIIISDHADNLNLDGFTFEKYVKARWRKESEGLIDVTKLKKE